MSKKGQFLRGEKWFHLSRDVDGNLKKDIKEDKDKMIDINYYLEEKKRIADAEVPAKETKSKEKK